MKKLFVLMLSVFAGLFSHCAGPAPEQVETASVTVPAVITSSETSIISLQMYPELVSYIESAREGMAAIPAERKALLQEIADFVRAKQQAGEPVGLNFICTHNSRRSHFGQIWAATAAAYYGVDSGLKTYSGGTEATAFNPRAVAAVERAGLLVEKPEGSNPRYIVRFAENGPEIICFSKKYDDPVNTSRNMVAVMTCSEADQNCPFIPGAALRVPIPYEDPKVADGTDQETARYDERCRQIATEMLYLMQQVKG